MTMQTGWCNARVLGRKKKN